MTLILPALLCSAIAAGASTPAPDEPASRQTIPDSDRSMIRPFHRVMEHGAGFRIRAVVFVNGPPLSHMHAG